MQVTLTVEAAYEPRTARSIALAFKSARAGGVALSPALQNLVASPLLPRGWWNLQALMWLRDVSCRAVGLGRGREAWRSVARWPAMHKSWWSAPLFGGAGQAPRSAT